MDNSHSLDKNMDGCPNRETDSYSVQIRPRRGFEGRRMSNMLKWFVKINRDISGAFIHKFPKLSHGHRIAAAEFEAYIDTLIERRGSGPFTVLEIGGIDRPRLKKDPRYRYIGLDVDVNDNCYEIYDEFYVQSVEEPIPAKADLIISKTVLEHVPNVRKAFQRMYDCLNQGGEMLHLVPGGYHPYSLANKFVGHEWQKKLIGLLLPPDYAKRLGYKAYYDLCSYRQMKRLISSFGPEHTSITPYWDAVVYFKFLFPLFLTVVAFNRIAEILRVGQVASYLVIYFKK
jgi:SAM-dependent methyltransferase